MSKSQKYEGISNKPLQIKRVIIIATDKINSIKYLERQKLPLHILRQSQHLFHPQLHRDSGRVLVSLSCQILLHL